MREIEEIREHIKTAFPPDQRAGALKVVDEVMREFMKRPCKAAEDKVLLF